jgi:nitrogen fixation NifU-like protein
MELDSLYQEVILDHYKHPLNKKLKTEFTAQVHHVNPSCGDEITLNVTISNQIVTSVSWDGVGCSISQASTSIASELMIGKNLEDALKIVDSFSDLMSSKGTMVGNEEILEDGVALAGVSKFPARIKCALLGWMAFKDAAIQSSKN